LPSLHRRATLPVMLRLLLPVLALAACTDESLSGYADPAAIYRLTKIDGAPFAARATASFPDKRRIAGQAPCNRYSGELSAPYPWFKTGPLMVTRMACADLAAEQIFFAALTDMTLAEVQGPTLILSNIDGREMVFTAQP